MHPEEKYKYYFNDNNTDDVMGMIQSMKVVKCVQVGILGDFGYEKRAGNELAWRTDAAICTVIFTKCRSFRVAARVRAGRATLVVLHVEWT